MWSSDLELRSLASLGHGPTIPQLSGRAPYMASEGVRAPGRLGAGGSAMDQVAGGLPKLGGTEARAPPSSGLRPLALPEECQPPG